MWDDEGPHDLGTLDSPDGWSIAYAISADGLPVGRSSSGPDSPAVLWTPYGISNLGTLPDGHAAWALAISNGVIVGVSCLPTPQGVCLQHAFVYDNNDGPGYELDLNDMIPAGTDWELYGGTGINPGGQIVGNGRLGDYVNRRAFLLTPLEARPVLPTPARPSATSRQ